MSTSTTSGVRVINRATDILFLLSHHPDGLSLREISRHTRLPRSTVQRIVSALEESNLVIAASAAGGFRLGPALKLLAASVPEYDIVKIARPLLQQLVNDLEETVDLAILTPDKAVVVDQVPGRHPLLAVSAIGSSLPLHGSASGKSLLAALPVNKLESLKKQLTLEALTDHTITSWEELDRELERVRSSGLAYDHEEYRPGISAVGTILRGPLDELAAVSLSAPTERFNANRDRLAETLLARCQVFQRRLFGSTSS